MLFNKSVPVLFFYAYHFPTSFIGLVRPVLSTFFMQTRLPFVVSMARLFPGLSSP